MDSTWIAALGIVGTLGAAVTTQLLQARATERHNASLEERRLQDQQRQSLADFADQLMSYRRAQLHNWHLARELGASHDDTEVSAETRELRARSWSACYRVRLLWPNGAVADGARDLVDAVGDLKRSPDADALAAAGDGVRDELWRLMDTGRDALLRGGPHQRSGHSSSS